MSVRMFIMLGAVIFAAVGYKLDIGALDLNHLFAFAFLGAIVGGVAGLYICRWWDDL